MDRPVVALAVVLFLGAVAYWWVKRNEVAPETPTTTTTPDPCGGGVLGTVGSFIKGHVDRKNAVAPFVASAYAKISPAQAAPITKVAGELSLSNKVESYVGDKVGNALCSMSVPSITAIGSAAVATVQKVTTSGASFGASQLKAGTVTPVKDLYSAGQSLARGDIGGTARGVVNSVVDGPKAAYNATKSFVSSLNPF